jgi:hypothetical protein
MIGFMKLEFLFLSSTLLVFDSNNSSDSLSIVDIVLILCSKEIEWHKNIAEKEYLPCLKLTSFCLKFLKRGFIIPGDRRVGYGLYVF